LGEIGADQAIDGDDTVGITKATFTKLDKLFKNAGKSFGFRAFCLGLLTFFDVIVDSVMEKLGKEDGDEESESEEQEDDGSEESEKMDVEEKKAPPKSQPARTILRAKRKTPAVKEEKKQLVIRSTRSKSPKKKSDDTESEEDAMKDNAAQPLTQPMLG